MTRREGRVIAQAKINLSLRVLARESSGYHQLETLFARIDLGDLVTVRTGGRGRVLRCEGPAASAAEVGPPERNLAWRAAEAYARETGFPDGFEIDIDKRIPVGAGLGGGSADAGAVLRILNRLAPAALPEERLVTLAGSLGADVPFLAVESPLALAWGRGDRMLMLPPLAARDVVLVLPGFAVSTPEAFRWLAEGRVGHPAPPAAVGAAALGSWAGVTSLAGNDFEEPVSARHPVIADAVEVLAASGARIAQLTGSGSTVFGIFDAPPDQAAIAASLPCPVECTRTATRVVAVDLLE